MPRRRKRPIEETNPIAGLAVLVLIGGAWLCSQSSPANQQPEQFFSLLCWGFFGLSALAFVLWLINGRVEAGERQRLAEEEQQRIQWQMEHTARRKAELHTAWLKAMGQLFPERDVALLPLSPRELDPTKLELLAEQVYRQRGDKTEHTGGAGDRGVDVKITNALGQVFIVQCKQYQSRLQPNKIREVRGTLRGKQKGIVWAPGGYTEAAREEAKRSSIELLDEQGIRELIEEVYPAPLASHALTSPEPDSGLPRPVTSGPEQLPPLPALPTPEWKSLFIQSEPTQPTPAPRQLPLGFSKKQWAIIAAMCGVAGVLALVLVALLTRS